MKKDREIPVKNYIILGIITLITIILTIYINAWFKTYKENKVSISPFSGVIEEVNIDEINLILSEMNERVLYVSYTNDKKIYDMEKRLVKYIKNHNLVDKFIYVNVTDNIKDEEYIEILKNTFVEKKDEIVKAPLLLYVKNGKVDKVINSESGVINTYDIANLNETYKLDN